MIKSKMKWLIVALALCASAGSLQGCKNRDRNHEKKAATATSKVSQKKFVDGRFTNTLGMIFVRISAGTFVMGSPVSEDDEYGSRLYEKQHMVEIKRDFWISAFEVTNAQYRVFDKDHKSGFLMYKGEKMSLEGDKHPVVNVSWDDATRFCRWLSEKEGRHYRLPTEAEWEYACRAGSKTRFYFGDDSSLLPKYAWCRLNSGYRTHPVGTRKSNAWGLYDMHGNVWEWCQDWFAPYPDESPKDYGGRKPPRPKTGRVFRGGDSFTIAGCRSAVRRCMAPSDRTTGVGFRIIMEIR